MKSITIALLLISGITHAQVSIDAGLTSRGQGTGKIAYEKQISWSNTELGARVSLDNYHPVISLQTGATLIVDRFDQELRLAVSANYHTGLLPVDKCQRIQSIRFGGSIRFKWSVNVYVSGSYDGETAALSIGYLIKRRDNF